MVSRSPSCSVTRDDVAQACGVSGALVSYAFSEAARDKVKPETRKRIFDAAKELGYRPNFTGRALKTRRSYNIAIVLPERFTESFSLHHLRIFHGICHSINQTDYRPMVFFGVNDKFFNTVRDRRVDGIIVQDFNTDLNYVAKLLHCNLPLVLANVDYPFPAGIAAGWVRSDHEQLVADCMTRMIAHGCRRLAAVSCLPETCQPNLRLNQAFEAQLSTYRTQGVHGVLLNPDHPDWLKRLDACFREGGPATGILVDGTMFIEPIMAAARACGVTLELDRNFFVVESSTAEVGIWVHDSKQIGRRAWAMMNRMLNQEPGTAFEKIPFLLADDEILSHM